jgi:hypothetical protein
MGSVKVFAQLENDARSIMDLLSQTSESLNLNELEQLFESGEVRCKDALDDHYVSMRLAR